MALSSENWAKTFRNWLIGLFVAGHFAWPHWGQDISFAQPCTEWMECMSHRKLKETKQQPSMLPCPAVPGCCLVSFHFMCNIHSIHSVHVHLVCILFSRTVHFWVDCYSWFIAIFYAAEYGIIVLFFFSPGRLWHNSRRGHMHRGRRRASYVPNWRVLPRLQRGIHTYLWASRCGCNWGMCM